MGMQNLCPFYVLKLKGDYSPARYQMFSIEDGKYVPFGSTESASKATTFMWDNASQGFSEIVPLIVALNPEELYEPISVSKAIANEVLKETFEKCSRSSECSA